MLKLARRLKFLTNNFTLPALTIARIYKQRWQEELYFKWIKQHLRIKASTAPAISRMNTRYNDQDLCSAPKSTC